MIQFPSMNPDIHAITAARETARCLLPGAVISTITALRQVLVFSTAAAVMFAVSLVLTSSGTATLLPPGIIAIATGALCLWMMTRRVPLLTPRSLLDAHDAALTTATLTQLTQSHAETLDEYSGAWAQRHQHRS